MEVIMFRKVFTASIIALFITGTVISPSASAAVAVNNGAVCTKANATKIVSGFGYKCVPALKLGTGSSVNYVSAANLQVKGAKLLWLSTQCLKAVTSYANAKTSYELYAAKLPATLADLDTQSAEYLATIAANNVKIKEFEDMITKFTAERDVLANDRANAAKNLASVNKYNQALLKLQSAKSAIKIATDKVVKLNTTLLSKKTKASSDIAALKTGLGQSLQGRAMICMKGL